MTLQGLRQSDASRFEEPLRKGCGQGSPIRGSYRPDGCTGVQGSGAAVQSQLVCSVARLKHGGTLKDQGYADAKAKSKPLAWIAQGLVEVQAVRGDCRPASRW